MSVFLFSLLLINFSTPNNNSIKIKIGTNLSKCYRMAKARNYKLHGKLGVTVKADNKGKIIQVKFIQDNIGNLPLIRCIRYTLLRSNIYPKKQLTFNFKFPKMKQYTIWSGDIPIIKSNNQIALRYLLDDLSVNLNKSALNLMRISKGGNLKNHFHKLYSILGIVIEGTGELKYKTSKLKVNFAPLSSGTFFFIPYNMIHEIKGNSEPPLIIAMFYIPRSNKFSKHFSIQETLKSDTILNNNNKLKFAKSKVKIGFINFNNKPSKPAKNIFTLKLHHKKIEFYHIKTPINQKFKFKQKGTKLGFILNGGGNLKIKKDKYPITSGSGFYIPHRAIYIPAQNKNLNAIYINIR